MIHKSIYSPEEDSFLLAEEVKKYIASLNSNQKATFKILDMGSGSGIQAKTAVKEGIKRKNIICADVNPEAIKQLKEQKLPARKSNLFLNINNNKKFDLIIFNAPYLPEDRYDKQPDTTAGKKGNEIILKFLRKAKSHITSKGIILILFSNLSRPKEIINYAIKKGYNLEKLAEKNTGMMEKLLVYKLSFRILLS